MNQLPKLSIITPVYNSEQYLGDCISSILEQTFSDFELILINDGSTDGSGQLCDRWAMKDARIRVYHQINMGPAAARNVGIEKAKGEYIGFCDSDDVLLPEYYQVLMSNILKYNADISGVSFISVDEQGNASHTEHTNKIYVFDNEEGFEEFLSRRVLDIHIWTKLYKKRFLDENNIRFDYIKNFKLEEDFLFNLKAFCASRCIVFEDKHLYTYLKKETSLSREFYRKNIKSYMHNGLLRIYKIEETTRKEYPHLLYLAKRQSILYMIMMISRASEMRYSQIEPYFSYIMRYLRRNKKQVINDRSYFSMKWIGVWLISTLPPRVYYIYRKWKNKL